MRASTDSKSSQDPLVYVVDDDASVRAALTNLLESVSLTVLAFGSVDDFLAVPRRDAPSCLVLDVRLPGMSGMDLHEKLEQQGHHFPVIFMTGYGDIPMSVRAMKAGALDFLAKPFRDQEMIDAVMGAIQIDRRRRASQTAGMDLQNRRSSLSARERSVFEFATGGMLNKQIAGVLGITEATVKVHRANVMKKMEAHSFAELVKFAEALRLNGHSAVPS